jgi:hypothetical protein
VDKRRVRNDNNKPKNKKKKGNNWK